MPLVNTQLYKVFDHMISDKKENQLFGTLMLSFVRDHMTKCLGFMGRYRRNFEDAWSPGDVFEPL